PGTAMDLVPETDGEAAWLRPRKAAWLLLSFRYREGAGNAPAGAAFDRIAVRPARRAAPVDRRAPAIEVDDEAPAAQIVAALAQLDIADHRDQPPVEVVYGDIAFCGLVALHHRHAARRVEPVDVGAAGARIGDGHPRRGDRQPRLRHADIAREHDAVGAVLHLDAARREIDRRIAVVVGERLRLRAITGAGRQEREAGQGKARSRKRHAPHGPKPVHLSTP